LKIRAYQPADLERLKQLHEQQGFGYPFPDLDGPLFPVVEVGEEAGEIQICGALRVTAEAYLLMDGGYGTPRDRWQALLNIHEAVRRKATEAGFAEVQAFIPPEIAKRFGRKLAKLKWRTDKWEKFQFNLPDG
jgi:hypothetical protein